MGICNLITRKLDVPGEDGQWIEVRPLSLQTQYTLELAAGVEARAAVAADGNVDLEATESFAKLSKFLQGAIIAWSYPVPVTQENIDDLEQETTLWLSSEIGRGAEVPLPITEPSTESLVEDPEMPLTDGQSADTAKSSDVDPQS